MILVYLARSALISAANWSGVEMKGSIPWLNSFSLMSGIVITLAISAPNLSMIALGVAAGASIPYQMLTTKPFRPDSMAVGSSGSAESRVSPEIVMALSRPLLICERATIGGLKYICT